MRLAPYFVLAHGIFRACGREGVCSACGRKGDFAAAAAKDGRHHFFSFPSKEKKRFRASKEEKGACWNIVPRKPRICIASAMRRLLAGTTFLHAGMPATELGIKRTTYNPPRDERRGPRSGQSRRKQYDMENSVFSFRRKNKFKKILPVLRDSKTVGFGGFLVTFSAAKKSLRPQAE